MKGSNAGAAESITVTHRWAAGHRDAHILDVQWVDSHHIVHGRRTVVHEEGLRCPQRAVHVTSVAVPGVGVVRVDCSVPQEPHEELVWRAELIRESDLWSRAHGTETSTFPLPIDWEEAPEELVG